MDEQRTDERRQHARERLKSAPIIVWLLLSDDTKQMGVIDDHGDGGACIELNGIVASMAAGDVVGIECEAQPTDTDGETIPALGRVAWITGRHLGLQFLTANTATE